MHISLRDMGSDLPGSLSSAERAALHWWHQRITARSEQQAEVIRDRLLQELLSLRRSMELQSSHSAMPPAKLETWLSQADSLYLELDMLSNALAPPFAEDNLLLALQAHLQQWERQHPDINFSIHVNRDVSPHITRSNNIFLILFDELLKLLSQKYRIQEINVYWRDSKLSPTLEVHLEKQWIKPDKLSETLLASINQSLHHLQISYGLLTGLSCTQESSHNSETWKISLQ